MGLHELLLNEAVLDRLVELMELPQSAEPWRDMASAPRDGTRIVVLRKPHPRLLQQEALVSWRAASPLRTGHWRNIAGGSPVYDDLVIGWKPASKEAL